MVSSRETGGAGAARRSARSSSIAAAAWLCLFGVAGVPSARAEDAGRPSTTQLLERLERLERRMAAEERLGGSIATPVSQRLADLPRPDDGWRSPYTNLGAAARPPSSEEDERALQRALERSLVREGGLVLAPWRVEVEPRVEYTYRKSSTMVLANGNGGSSILVEEQQRRDRVEASLTARTGLPLNSQGEVEVRYLASHQASVSSAGASRDQSTGLDSVRVGLSNQIFRESDGFPALLGSVGYTEAFGDKRLDPVSGLRVHGAGFDSVEVGLTAVKSQDPLVFFLTGSYSTSFAERVDGEKIRPGDVAGGKVGMLLAVNPETSLQLGFEAAYSFDAELNGEEIEGTEDLAAVLEIGASTVLSESTLLSVTAGAGLTDVAPDVRLSLSLSQGLW